LAYSQKEKRKQGGARGTRWGPRGRGGATGERG